MNITSLDYQEFRITSNTAEGRYFAFAGNDLRMIHLSQSCGFHVSLNGYWPDHPSLRQSMCVVRRERLGYIPSKGTLVFAFVEQTARGWHATWWGLVEEMDKALHDLQMARKGKPAPKVPQIFSITDPRANPDLGVLMDRAIAVRRVG